MKAVMKYCIAIIIGGVIGGIIGYFGKCASGTCPMTSNPYVSASIGALIGFVVAWGR